MAYPYSRTTWQDRQVANPMNFTATGTAAASQGGTLVITPNEGTVTQTGTAFTASIMNNIEQGIVDLNNNKLDLISGGTVQGQTTFNGAATFANALNVYQNANALQFNIASANTTYLSIVNSTSANRIMQLGKATGGADDITVQADKGHLFLNSVAGNVYIKGAASNPGIRFQPDGNLSLTLDIQGGTLHRLYNNYAMLKWLGASGGGLQVRDAGDSTYLPIAASAFNVGSSHMEIKKNVTQYTDSVLAFVNSTQVYNYNLQTDPDTMTDKRIGLMIDYAPKEILSPDMEFDAIDMYQMSAVLWKAVQELSVEIKTLNDKVGV